VLTFNQITYPTVIFTGTQILAARWGTSFDWRD
jgi:hypothetical protein